MIWEKSVLSIQGVKTEHYLFMPFLEQIIDTNLSNIVYFEFFVVVLDLTDKEMRLEYS